MWNVVCHARSRKDTGTLLPSEERPWLKFKSWLGMKGFVVIDAGMQLFGQRRCSLHRDGSFSTGTAHALRCFAASIAVSNWFGNANSKRWVVFTYFEGPKVGILFMLGALGVRLP